MTQKEIKQMSRHIFVSMPTNLKMFKKKLAVDKSENFNTQLMCMEWRLLFATFRSSGRSYF